MTQVNICFDTCDEETYQVKYVIVEVIDQELGQPRRAWIETTKEIVDQILDRASNKHTLLIEANGEKWVTTGSFTGKEHINGNWRFHTLVMPFVTIT
jgi:hypothetical protein